MSSTGGGLHHHIRINQGNGTAKTIPVDDETMRALLPHLQQNYPELGQAIWDALPIEP